MDDPNTIRPSLSPSELEEVAGIGYLLDQLEPLRARDLISDEAYARIGSEYGERRARIERAGRFRSALGTANTLAMARPRDALGWAEAARRLEPDRPEPVGLMLDLLARLGRIDEAIVLADEVAGRFPALAGRGADLRRKKADREATDRLDEARRALDGGRPAEAIAICSEVLESQPEQSRALAILAFAHEKLGHHDVALAQFRRLAQIEPANRNWTRRIVELNRQIAGVSAAVAPAAAFLPATAAPMPSGPPVSWSSIAGEFLEEHWQKLLLCLAVFLILVSSTVGAHHLLGRWLWSPAGKCLLALAYTAMIGALGTGLVRWGAGRAGRIMLLTTLAVVPVDFSLVGELRLLIQPSTSHLLIFTVVAAVLLGLCWVVTSALSMRGNGLFPLAFFAISAFNAGAARGVPFGIEFPALIGAAIAFLGSVWSFNANLKGGEGAEERRDFAYFALALLAYAFLYAVARAGIYVLELIPRRPWLLAVPVMLAAIACVQTAQHLPKVEKDPRRVHLMRLAGFVLAALAFALALARPPFQDRLTSANTVVTALLGLGLFGWALRVERKPAYLYVAFGSLFVAYFGIYELRREAIQHILTVLGHALGYPGMLPTPFRALNGIVFNAGLVLLGAYFRRRWDDPRLARHCQWIGLPLSVAACLLSGFEPLAAVLCLSIYAAAYAVAAGFYGRPWLVYLAAAAAAGASISVLRLVPAIEPDGRALSVAGVGLAFWIAARLMGTRGADRAYRMPVLHASFAMGALAAALAAVALVGPIGLTWPAIATMFAVAILFGLIGLDLPERPLAYLAVAAGVSGYLLLIARLAPGERFGLHANLIMAAGMVLAAAGEGVRRLAGRREPGLGRPSRPGIYNWPLQHAALAMVAIGSFFGAAQCGIQILGVTLSGIQVLGPTPSGLGQLAGALALGAATLFLTSAFAYQTIATATLTVTFGVLAFAAAAISMILAIPIVPTSAALAIAFGGLSIALNRWGERLALADEPPRAPLPLYRLPLIVSAFVAVGLTALLAAWNREEYPFVAAALALGSITLAISTRLFPIRPLAYLATFGALGVWLCLFEIADGGRVASRPVYGVLLAAYGLALLAPDLLIRRRLAAIEADRQATAAGSFRRTFAVSLPELILLTILAADVLAATGPSIELAVVAALILNAMALIGLTHARREQAMVYGGVGHAVAASLCYCGWLVGWAAGIGLGWLALTLATAALVLWGLGFAGRMLGVDRFYVGPCLNVSVLLTVGVFALAIAARLEAIGSYPLGMAALLLNAAVFALHVPARRSAGLTFAAVASIVAATYLALLSQGHPDPANAYVLGLAAAVLAIGFWAFGFAIGRRLGPSWDAIVKFPLDVSSLVLTALAVPLAHYAPGSLLLAALGFLLMLRSFPASGWLYPALGCIGLASYHAIFRRWPEPDLIPAALAVAFVLWLGGVLAQKYQGRICAGLGLEDLGYEYPLFNAGLLVAMAALALRIDLGLRFDRPWTTDLVVYPILAAYALLAIRPYPNRGWVHLALTLLTCWLVLLAYPRIDPAAWFLVGALVAGVWLVVHRGLGHAGGPLARRLGIEPLDYAAVVGDWSLGTFAVTATALASALLINAAHLASKALPWEFLDASRAWPEILLALLVTSLVADRAALQLGRPWPRAFLAALPALLAWWLGVPHSPIVSLTGLSVQAFLPPATAAAGVLTALMVNLRLDADKAGRRTWRFWLGDDRAAVFARHAPPIAIALAVLAPLFSRAEIGWPATSALFGTAAIFATLAISIRDARLALPAATAWVIAVEAAALTLTWPPGRSLHEMTGGALALAASLAAVTLIEAGYRLGQARDGAEDTFRAAVTLILEVVAIGATVLAAFFTFGAVDSIPLSVRSADLGIVALLVVAWCYTRLAQRRRASWPIYPAQGSLVAAYWAYRLVYPMPDAADAIVLVALGYLDLGIAEVLQRLRLDLYARPTLFFALALPLLPLMVALGRGSADEINLFIAFAAGTFYTVAALKLRWKTLGYAAAVLYNAFLWIFWSRLGWRLADDPQFYLVPVGLSTVLFAEVNREELGRPYVNALRTIGLIVVYISLAVPIWHVASFGAWLALLLLSLAGVFAGIGLRVQTFLWMGLVTFCLDVVYQVGRVGMENTLAKWGIMWGLGILLFLFVALNEKKQILATMRRYYSEARQWE